MQAAERLPQSPHLTTQPAEIRRFLGLLIAICLAMGVVDFIAAFVVASPRWFAAALLLWALAAWLAVFPRRAIRHGDAESVVMRTAIVFIVAIVAFSILQPFPSLVLATAVLIPVAVALPYVGVRSLRRLLVLSWAGAVVAVAAGYLPDDVNTHTAMLEAFQVFAIAIVIGLVFFFLYQ